MKRLGILLLMLVVIAPGCVGTITKTDDVFSMSLIAGQASLDASNDCADGENCENISLGGGQFSEGFMAAILSPVTFVLKGALQALLPETK